MPKGTAENNWISFTTNGVKAKRTQATDADHVIKVETFVNVVSITSVVERVRLRLLFFTKLHQILHVAQNCDPFFASGVSGKNRK